MRSTFAAIAVAALCLFAAGCQEDRSNLLPPESRDRIEDRIEKIRTQVVDGLCFEALRAAQGIEEELDGLGQGVDPVLLRTLRDGVTQLQITIQSECVESGDVDPGAAVEEVDPPEEEVTPPSGGTTTPAEGNGGGQQGQGGQQRPEPAPAPQPTPEPTPPTPPDNSGGVSPSSSGSSTGA